MEKGWEDRDDQIAADDGLLEARGLALLVLVVPTKVIAALSIGLPTFLAGA
jgi:hypothetical protein